MGKFHSILESKEMDNLCDAFLTLETREDCYKFFDDIFTISEIKAAEQRFQVAKMLKEKNTYQEIAKLTGASTATISRVNRCINYGSNGYNQVMDRIDKNNK